MCDTISAKSKNDALELLRAKDVANPEEFLNQVEKFSKIDFGFRIISPLFSALITTVNT